jgi:squalene-hopene/tetraprenyl-beta-curcumene cyclase
MRVSAATPQEARIIQEATRRVESYGAHQPLYDHNESKKTESRGTEAVLNALILASADAAHNRREPGSPTQQALKRLWETERPDGAWDWLDFGLEPFETVDGAYYGATLAALAVGIAPGSSTNHAAETSAGIERLRGYLKEKYASQSLFNRAWLLLASTRLNGLLTGAQREALITELQGRQRDDGGWALDSLGPWKWSKTAAPFRAPGTPEAALLAKSDGYATGLIVYTLRQAGLPTGHPAVSKGLQWLKANQQKVQVGQHDWPAWRAHSLNFDREHGGEKGEPWRRMFMSDSATAFAALALIASD